MLPLHAVLPTPSPGGLLSRSKRTKLPWAPDGPAWLPVTSPLLPDWDALAPRLQAILERGWLTNQGAAAQELERVLRAALGAPNAHLMTNGTLALEVLIRAALPFGEILVPAYSFPATWNLLLDDPRYRVRFVDVGEDGNLDPDAAAAAIGPETTGILAVHAYGFPCHPDALQGLATRHGLSLIFDAAHAFGVRWHGTPLGALGDGSAWSFHATKVFNTLEGGAVTTRHDPVVADVEARRNFGFAPGGQQLLGTNAKLDEFRAAFGLTTMPLVPAAIEARGRVARAYDETLHEVTGLRLPTWLRGDETFTPNHAYYPVFFDTGESRAAAEAALKAVHVLPRRYFASGLFEDPAYEGLLDPSALPVAHRLSETVLCLPIHHAMTDGDVALVVETLRAHLGA